MVKRSVSAGLLALILLCLPYIANAGTLQFDGVPVDITTTDGEDLVMVPGTGGNIQVGDGTGENLYATTNDDLHVTGVVEVNGGLFADGGILSGSDVLPDTTDAYDLGAVTKIWKNLYVGNIEASGNLAKIRDISYVWPAAQGAVNTFLRNDGAGNLTWVAVGGGGGAISALTAATATNTIANSTYAQIWNWSLGATGNAGLTLGETAAATAGGKIFNVSTLATSTAVPLTIDNLGAGNAFVVNDQAADTTPFVVAADGNVGLGAAVPSSLLDVNGAFTMREMAAPALSPADQGRIYFDDTDNKFKVSEHGGAYVDLINPATSSKLNAITDADGANTTANGDFAQVWNFALATADKDAFTFGETTAATGGGTQSILKATTLATSTAVPLRITNLGAGDSFRVNDETGDSDATPFLIAADGSVGIGTASPAARLNVNVADAATNAVTNVLYLDHTLSSGTAANGIGAAMKFRVPSDAGTLREAFEIQSYLWPNADTAEMGFAKFRVMRNSALVDMVTLDAANFAMKFGDGTVTNPEIQMNGVAYGTISNTNGVLYVTNNGNADMIFSQHNAAGNITFRTTASDTTRMTLLNDGNVGIGTSTVSNKLEVVGTVASGNSSGGTAGSLKLYDADGATPESVTINAPSIVDGASYAMTLPAAQASAAGQVLSNDGAGNLSWANVASGSATLDAIQAAAGSATIGSANNDIVWNWALSTATKSAFTFGESGASTNGAGAQSILKAATLGSSTAMPLWIVNEGDALSLRIDDVASDTSPFIVAADGNVGVGTTSSAAKLDVIGQGRFEAVSGTAPLVVPTAYAAGANVTNLSSDLLDGIDSAAFPLLAGRAGGQTLIGGTGAGDDLVLRSSSNVTKGDILLVDQGGNVAIGTTVAAHRLTLDGNFAILETGASPQYYSIFQGGDQAADVTYTLPTAQASGAKYLRNDGAGILTWADATVTSLKLNQLTAADNTNTIASGDNAQFWNWQLTTADKDAFTFGETTASTATGVSAILKASTLATSTATPFIVTNLGDSASLRVNDETGDADATPFLVDAAGNVGVGTTTTASKLDVIGQGRFETASGTAPLVVPTAYAAGANVANLSVDLLDGLDSTAFSLTSHAHVFTSLTDAPSSYSGAGLNLVRVNAGATGLEFLDETSDFLSQYALLAGRSGGQTLIGGSGTTDDLILRTTSGAGASGADMIFQVGNNGATEAMRILNSGDVSVGVGTFDNGSAEIDLYVKGNLEVDGILYGNASGLTNVPGGALSALSDATTGHTLTNGDNAQVWNWQLTTADKDAFTFGETTASTATGVSAILKASTLATSTAVPLMVTNLGAAYSLRVNDETGDTDASPFVVAADGNVGIGTTAPEMALHVTGTAEVIEPTIGGSLRLSNTPTGLPGRKEFLLEMSAGLSIARLYANVDGTPTHLVLQDTGGNVGIGDTGPDYQFEIGSASPAVASLGLSDSNVAHGLTDAAQTDVFFELVKLSTTAGGARMTAFSDSDAAPLQMRGVIGSNDPTDTLPAFKVIGAKSDGVTGLADLGAGETVLSVANNDDTPAVVVLGGGNVGIGTDGPGAQLHLSKASGTTSLMIGSDTRLLTISQGDGTLNAVFNSNNFLDFATDSIVRARIHDGGLSLGNPVGSWGGSLVFFDNDGSSPESITVNAPSGANLTASYALTLPAAAAVSNGQALVSQTDGTLSWATVGGSDTLQQAYNNDADGSDAILALTTADDSLIFRNPAASGSDSTFLAHFEQLATGAVDNTIITHAGTGYALRVNDDGTATDASPFVIDQNGNVGIGTTGTSSYKLHVSSSEFLFHNGSNGIIYGTAGKLSLGHGLSPIAGLDVRFGVNAAAGAALGNNFQNVLTATANNDALTALRITPTFTDGAFTGVTHDALIVDSGNVGIGTSTTTAKLTFRETSSASALTGIDAQLLGGYTGASGTYAFYSRNAAAGTGTQAAWGTANYGFYLLAEGVTATGHNVGSFVLGANGARNYGAVAVAADNEAIGVYGGADPAGTTLAVGGLFALENVASPSAVSAALIANNGSTTSPIFLGRDNNTTVFSIIDGGNVGIGSTAPGSSLDVVSADGLNLTTPIMTIVNNDVTAGQGQGLLIKAGNLTGGGTDTPMSVQSRTGTMLFEVNGSNGNVYIGQGALYLNNASAGVNAGYGSFGDLTVDGISSFLETTAPTQTASYGKLYVKSSDSNLYFMNDSGAETNLLAGAVADTLQAAYGNDADGSDAVIALTTADDSLIFRNPAASGSDSTFLAHFEQLATGAVDDLIVTHAGTGYALRVNDDGTTTDSTPFVIDQNGNVGIGTTAAGANLHVLGSSGVAMVESNGGDWAYSILRFKNNHGASVDTADIKNIDDAIVFSDDTATKYPLAVYTDASRLGVNTFSSLPESDLAVNGKVAIGSASYWQYGGIPANGLIVEGNVGIGTITVDRKFHVEADDASNTAVTYLGRLTHTTSGVPGAGIGTGLEFEAETAAGNNEIGAALEAVLTDATAASEDFDLVFKNMAAGAAAAEVLRVSSTGLTTLGAAGTDGSLKFYNELGATDYDVTIIPSASQTASYSLTLPTAQASGAKFLRNDGSGVLSWADATAAADTLQQAYDADGDGSDTIIVLTTADDSLIFRNPASSGSDSATLLTLDQLDTGAKGALIVNSYGTGDALVINDVSGDTTPFVVDQNGNVGVGTATPQRPFHVDYSSNATTTGTAIVSTAIGNPDTTNNNFALLGFYTYDGAAAWTSAGRVGTQFTSHAAGAVSGDLVFDTRDAGTLAERARIKSDGNVGIGTTNPQYNLEGKGTLRFTGTSSVDSYIDYNGANSAIFSVSAATGNAPYLTLKTTGGRSVSLSQGATAFSLTNDSGGASTSTAVSILNNNGATNTFTGIGTTATVPNSQLHVGGSLSLPLTTKVAGDSPYTATGADHTIAANCAAGAITVNLPTAVGITGRTYVVKKIDSSSNAVTVDASGTQTIDGDLTKGLFHQNRSLTLQSDGANWVVI